MNESTPSSPNMLSSFSKKCSTVFLHHLQTFSMSCLINIQLCNPISCVSRPKKSRCVKRRDGWCRRFKDIFHPLVSLTNLNMSVYRVKKRVKQFVKTAELGGGGGTSGSPLNRFHLDCSRSRFSVSFSVHKN